MVNQDVIMAKMANIQRSLSRLKEKQNIGFDEFSVDRDLQDIVLLNLQNAIQGCVDMASHIVADNNWGVPGSLAGLFDVICEKKVIIDSTRRIMRSMVGFRNLIVHEYAELDMSKVYEVFSGRLSDFDSFLKEIILYAEK